MIPILKHIKDHLKDKSESIENKKSPEESNKLLRDFAKDLKISIDSLLKNSPTINKNSKFKNNIENKWHSAFDSLENLILLCIELGSQFSVKNGGRDISLDTFIRLHANACLISQEILCLMRSGFPDGAHARWRTLHEKCVIALFISKHGNECANRYMDYTSVNIYKSIKLLEKYKNRSRLTQPTQMEQEEIKNRYRKLLKKYGDKFGKRYGWAASSLNDISPNFAKIEADVELDHWRTHYHWSSQSVHANPNGLRNSLATSSHSTDILLAGQSNFGMFTPAEGTSYSLMLITNKLLVALPEVESIVTAHLVDLYREEVIKNFQAIE